MDKPGNFADVPQRNTKTIDEKVAARICRFLRAWLLRHFYDASKESEFNATAAAEVLGLSQAYLSQLGRKHPGRSPGLSVVLRLREQSGASFEEITGHKAPLSPQRPFSVLSHDAHIAEEAAERALSAHHDERRESSTQRAAESKRPPRNR